MAVLSRMCLWGTEVTARADAHSLKKCTRAATRVHDAARRGFQTTTAPALRHPYPLPLAVGIGPACAPWWCGRGARCTDTHLAHVARIVQTTCSRSRVDTARAVVTRAAQCSLRDPSNGVAPSRWLGSPGAASGSRHTVMAPLLDQKTANLGHQCLVSGPPGTGFAPLQERTRVTDVTASRTRQNHRRHTRSYTEASSSKPTPACATPTQSYLSIMRAGAAQVLPLPSSNTVQTTIPSPQRRYGGHYHTIVPNAD